jgi:hypothetical protein
MSRSALDLVVGLSATFVLVAYISFALATVGEPYSVWIWRDLLGAIQ